MTAWLLLAALVLGLAAYVAHRRSAAGRLPGAVVYDDTVDRGSSVLVSHRFGLQGKPDHVIRTRGGLVPVERKTKDVRGVRPREGDRAQLLAYCLLVEEGLGERVSHGLLMYPSGKFVIPFGDRERAEIAGLLDVMRATFRAPDVRRSHEQAARCRACGFRSGCGEALV